jgi:hypothetical protein
LNALYVVEGLGDRLAGNGQQHGLGIRDVTTLSTDPGDLVARHLPRVREAAPDVALADHRDPHSDSFRKEPKIKVRAPPGSQGPRSPDCIGYP